MTQGQQRQKKEKVPRKAHERQCPKTLVTFCGTCTCARTRTHTRSRTLAHTLIHKDTKLISKNPKTLISHKNKQ